MHDEFGYLGAPGVVPKRAVTAQMLRDLVNFQSSLPVNDQWRIKSWIRLLQPFAEDQEILPSLGDSRPGELLNHFSARRNNIGATTSNNTSDLSVKDTDPHLDSSIWIKAYLLYHSINKNIPILCDASRSRTAENQHH